MDVTVDALILEIGRLHIQVMALQKKVAELQAVPQVPNKD